MPTWNGRPSPPAKRIKKGCPTEFQADLASAAALVSFEVSSGALKELADVEVGVSQVQLAAEAFGAEIETRHSYYSNEDGMRRPVLSAESAKLSSKRTRRVQERTGI
jgi:hypothetical protein